MTSGVYLILNTASGKAYIGSSKNIPGRLTAHKIALSRRTHCNSHLQRAWDRYGVNAFSFEMLEGCLPDKKALERREQYYIDLYDSMSSEKGYNHRGSERHGEISDEVRRRMSTVAQGKKWGPRSPEGRANLKAAAEKRSRNPEYLAKLRAALNTPEYRAKKSVQSKGMPNPAVSLALRGRKRSPELREKIRAAWQRPEVRTRMVAAQKEAWQRPEVRAKRVASLQAAQRKPEVRIKHSLALKGRSNLASKGRPWSSARRAAQKRNRRREV